MLFDPVTIGALSLDHRIVMAPLTRMRAGQPGNVPQQFTAEYYGQRASKGGLIIAEATQISPSAQGVPATPGIHSKEQMEGWRQVTSLVHSQGGRIVLQLWHVGRMSHSSLQPKGVLPVAPSAIAAAGKQLTASWSEVDRETPRALETSEVALIIEDYRVAAQNALDAGFDGVELHGANGYLIEQFLLPSSNQRSDRYGGSLANRTRLMMEVTAALIEVAGADRVGVRLSPFGANQSTDDNPLAMYTHAITALAELKPAYLHLIEARAGTPHESEITRGDALSAIGLFRSLWPGVLIAAGGYNPKTAELALRSGDVDAVAFGRLFVANPDLVDRIRQNRTLAPWDRSTFYGGDGVGYSDYPRWEPQARKA